MERSEVLRRICNYRLKSYVPFKKVFEQYFCEMDAPEDERLLKALYAHEVYIFRNNFTYTSMSPNQITIEFDAEGFTQKEYNERMFFLAQRAYEESDIYKNPIGAYSNMMADIPNAWQFIMQVTLVMLSQDNQQLIKRYEGYEMPVDRFARTKITNYIAVASVQGPKDLHTYLWLISCISTYLGLSKSGRQVLYYTQLLRETDGTDAVGGHLISMKMFNSLIKKQNYEKYGIYIPGELFGLETALPKPSDIFYQIMNSAVHEYEKKKI